MARGPGDSRGVGSHFGNLGSAYAALDETQEAFRRAQLDMHQWKAQVPIYPT